MFIRTWNTRGRTTIEKRMMILMPGPIPLEVVEEAEAIEDEEAEEAEGTTRSLETTKVIETAMMIGTSNQESREAEEETEEEVVEEATETTNALRLLKPEAEELLLARTAGSGDTETKNAQSTREKPSSLLMTIFQNSHLQIKSRRDQARTISTKR